MIFENSKIYDLLKTIALNVTPLVTFFSALCIIWKVPHAEQITASLAALDTLIGAWVWASSKKFAEHLEVVNANDQNENQILMAESMLEEDEKDLVKGE